MTGERTTAEFGAEATTGSSVMRGGLWKMLGNALPQLYALVISIAAARYLGPDGMGRQSFIAFAELSIIELLTSGFAIRSSATWARRSGRARGSQARWLARTSSGSWPSRPSSGADVSSRSGCSAASRGQRGSSPASRPSAARSPASGRDPDWPAALARGDDRRPRHREGSARWRRSSCSRSVGGSARCSPSRPRACSSILVWTGVLARRSRSAVSDESRPLPDLRRRSLRFAGYSSVGALLYLIVWRRSEFFFLNHYSADDEIAFYSIAFAPDRPRSSACLLRWGRCSHPPSRRFRRRGARADPPGLRPRAAAAPDRHDTDCGRDRRARPGGDSPALGRRVRADEGAAADHGRGFAAHAGHRARVVLLAGLAHVGCRSSPTAAAAHRRRRPRGRARARTTGPSGPRSRTVRRKRRPGCR